MKLIVRDDATREHQAAFWCCHHMLLQPLTQCVARCSRVRRVRCGPCKGPHPGVRADRFKTFCARPADWFYSDPDVQAPRRDGQGWRALVQECGHLQHGRVRTASAEHAAPELLSYPPPCRPPSRSPPHSSSRMPLYGCLHAPAPVPGTLACPKSTQRATGASCTRTCSTTSILRCAFSPLPLLDVVDGL